MPNFEAQIRRILEDTHLARAQAETLVRLDRELKANGRKAGTRLSYLFHLRNFALFVAKPFEGVLKDELVDYFLELDNNGWQEGSITIAKAKIKCFYKWLETGSFKGRKYPAKVEWIDSSPSKNKKLPFNLSDLLTHQDVKAYIGCCLNPRDKALISLLYESGGRAMEVLSMRLEKIKVEEHGVRIVLDGKTGERALLMTDSAPYLTLWLNHHPLRHKREGAFWVNHHNQRISYTRLHKLLKTLEKRSGINKHLHPHLFRHSQATYCAQFMTYAQLCKYFGWKITSKAPMIYIHLAGRDLDETILAMRGRAIEKKPSVDLTLSPKVCVRCGTENPGDAKFCNVCGLLLQKEKAQEVMAKDDALKFFSELMKDHEFREDLKEWFRLRSVKT